MGNSPKPSLATIQTLASFLESEGTCLQQLLDAFPIGIGIHTAAGKISYLNECGRSLLCIETAALPYLRVADLASHCGFRHRQTNEIYPIEHLPVFQALQGYTSAVDDIAIVRGDRCSILQSNAAPIRDAAGNITHVVATYQDITPQLHGPPERCSEEPKAQIQPGTSSSKQAFWVRPWLDSELRQSIVRFQRLAAAVPGVMYSLRVGPDRSIVGEYANQQVATLFEVDQLEFVRHPDRYFWKQMHPGDRWGFLRSAARCAKTQTPFTHEWRSITPAGRTRWLKTYSQPERYQDGTICWHGLLLDISDCKAAELLLQERETQYSRLITALPDLMFRVSRAGYWLGYVHNNAVIDCLPEGYDPVGHHISDHMPPAIAQQQMQKIEQAIATGEMQVFEQTLTVKERTQYEEVRILPQGLDEVLFIVRDITDRKTAELALKRSEAENCAILSAIPDLMFRLHRDGTFLGYLKTENTVDLLEAVGDVVGHSIFDFAQDDFYRDHIEKQMQAVCHVLDTGKMAVYEQKIPINSGWQHEEVRIIPTGEDEALLIIQNINNRKQAELALQHSEAQKQAILRAIPDLMFHMRQDGLILDYMGGNDFADLLEGTESHVGQNLWDFAQTESLAVHIQQKMAAMDRALTTGQMQIYEQETQVGHTMQQEEVRIVPVTGDEVLVMIRDISDRKRIEAELRAANDRLAKLSLTDSLTTLANRRRLDEHLQQEWQRSLREQQPISFILFDLDFFKRFNDTYGHQRGDECLFDVAQAVLTVVHRSSDLVARYGGEEFAVVLSNTQLKGAFILAQRICETIRALNIPHSTSDVDQVVTASLGVSAMIPTHAHKPNMLIRQADQALYAAKQAGRNNCQCFISR